MTTDNRTADYWTTDQGTANYGTRDNETRDNETTDYGTMDCGTAEAETSNSRTQTSVREEWAEAGQDSDAQPRSKRLVRRCRPEEREFRLEKGLGLWTLWLGRTRAILKHEIGLDYVAWLMAHPGEPIHALDLAARIHAMSGKDVQHGITEVENPLTGERVAIEGHSRVYERGMFLEEAETMRAVIREQSKLEAFVELEDTTEPEKEEAYRQLAALYDFEKNKGPRVRDAAARASDTVGKAIKRLVARLGRAVDREGQPHPIFRGLAAYIQERILVPSGRGVGHGGKRVDGEGGWFVCNDGPA